MQPGIQAGSGTSGDTYQAPVSPFSMSDSPPAGVPNRRARGDRNVGGTGLFHQEGAGPSSWEVGSGSKELNNARGLAIDEANKLIYVADCGNKRVQIVSFEGNFIKRFGQDKLSGHGV